MPRTSHDYGHTHGYSPGDKRTTVDDKHDHAIYKDKIWTGPGGMEDHKHRLKKKSKGKKMGKG
jgi:hypothetical protein